MMGFHQFESILILKLVHIDIKITIKSVNEIDIMYMNPETCSAEKVLMKDHQNLCCRHRDFGKHSLAPSLLSTPLKNYKKPYNCLQITLPHILNDFTLKVFHIKFLESILP